MRHTEQLEKEEMGAMVTTTGVLVVRAVAAAAATVMPEPGALLRCSYCRSDWRVTEQSEAAAAAAAAAAAVVVVMVVVGMVGVEVTSGAFVWMWRRVGVSWNTH